LRLELTVGLLDRPGQLLKALAVLAEMECNVVSIVHEREKAVEGVVPVSLVVETPHGVEAEEVRARLEARGVAVLRLQEVVKQTRLVAIASGLSGPVLSIPPGLSARVVNVEEEVSVDGSTSLKITLEGGPDEARRALEELRKLVEGQGGVLITPLEGSEG